MSGLASSLSKSMPHHAAMLVILTPESPVQPLKALLRMLVTLEGTVSEVSEVHPSKADVPMLVTPLFNVSVESEVQPENA